MQKIFLILIVYLIFLVLLYKNLPNSENKINNKNNAVYIILISIGIHLIVSVFMDGYKVDIECFKLWSKRLTEVGLHNFYDPNYFSDYPPGYMFVLYILGHIQKFLNLNDKAFIFLLKLPAVISDIILAILLYKNAIKEKIKLSPLFLLSALALSPFIIINSSAWGQIDSFFTLFIVLSLLNIYKEKLYSGAFFYAISILIKPQALMIAPLYLCVYLYKNKNWKIILKSLFIGTGTIILCSLPFSKNLNLMWLIQKYIDVLSSYPYASVNAYNLFALLGMNWVEIDIPLKIWSYITIISVTLFSIWFYIKSKEKSKIFYIPYIIITIMFTVGIKMHERYLFPALILLLFTYVFKKDKRLIWLFIVQSATHFLNVSDVLINSFTNTLPTPIILVFASLLHISTMIYSIYLCFDIFIPKKNIVKKYIIKKILLMNWFRNDYIIAFTITIIYGIIAFIGLGNLKAPQTFYNLSNEIFIDIGEVKNISNLMVYLGIGEEEYRIETSTNMETWTHYDTIKQDSVFVWIKLNKNNIARYLRINTNNNKYMIGEIGIFDEYGNQIQGLISNTEEIIDEQSTIPTSSSYMNGTYFDEIYHPRTAYEILHKISPYETTHPPLGKLLISLGIMIFGMNPFGWRFMGTLTGIIMIPIFYAFCKKLFKRRDLTVIGTIIFAFDFMHFSQTRLATIDSFAVLFILLMYYYILDYFILNFDKDTFKKGLKSLALSGLFFSLGIASKWICVYAGFGLAVIVFTVWIKAYFKHNNDYFKNLYKSILWCILFFIIVPAIIYFISYIPQMTYDLNGRKPIEYVLESQKYMYTYHKNIVASHPYSSKWYEWIIDKRPLWSYIDTELYNKGIVSSIYIFGNPLVWWGGFIAIIFCIYLSIFKNNKTAIFILIGYFSQLIPWMFVSRILFIYHYFASIPFLVLAIICSFKYLLDKRKIKMREVLIYCSLCVLLFIMFYPIISGMPVNENYVKQILQWFDSWTFI